jgi:hypothetical protein
MITIQCMISGSQYSSSDSEPGGSKLTHFAGLDTSRNNLFLMLDLKDTLFCIQLTSVSQPIFAFQWEDTQSGKQQQLTWTHLQQGFKSPKHLWNCPSINYVSIPS